MKWFKREPEKPLPVGILKDGAQFFMSRREENSLVGWTIAMRSVLIAKGYEPADVERAIEYLLH